MSKYQELVKREKAKMEKLIRKLKVEYEANGNPQSDEFYEDLMEERLISISDLRKVKGIGNKTVERIKQQLDELEQDKLYVSEYDPTMHIKPNTLVNGDMLEVMNGIPDKSVDMILTDLPYGTTACSWDTIIDFDKLWKQYNRVIKDNGAIVLTAAQPFSSALVSSNFKGFKHEWIWEKERGTGFQVAKYRPMQKHEHVLVFSKGGERVNYYPIKEKLEKPLKSRSAGTRSGSSPLANRSDYEIVYTDKHPLSILEFSRDNKNRIHPTQKPAALLEYLIKTYTKKGELVLDSTMGSGSTVVASINTNRQYIGIEMDKGYYEIAKERIGEVDGEQEISS